MSDHQKHTTLMTGVTGFLGHYILRELLKRGHRVVAVLRAPLQGTTSRLRNMMTQIGVDLDAYVKRDQLVLVEGSLPDALPEPTWGRTDDLINCAASLQLFSDDTGDPFRTNVEGTRVLIEYARRHKINRLHAVSTAYTCGWNTGVIPEAFHEPQPRFQTDYERSKWQAELMLKGWASEPGHILTVFRPSFLVGDSKTGHTTQFAGFYQFARLVSVLKDQFAGFHGNGNGARIQIPLRIPGRPEDRQNITPVDFVAEVIAEVVLDPEFHGRVYHLTNPEPPTNDFMKRCYEDYFGLTGGYFADPEEVLSKCSPAESLLWDGYDLLTPRVVHNPQFDTTNLKRVMEAKGLTFPVLDQKRIFMLFDYAANCGWGRRTNGFHSHREGKEAERRARREQAKAAK